MAWIFAINDVTVAAEWSTALAVSFALGRIVPFPLSLRQDAAVGNAVSAKRLL